MIVLKTGLATILTTGVIALGVAIPTPTKQINDPVRFGLKELKQKDKIKPKPAKKVVARKKIEVKKNVAVKAENANVSTTSCDQLRSRLSKLGVASSDLNPAIYIAQKESGCQSSAINPSSGACGEFQSLPCGKWGSPGTDQYLLNAISYANTRYGGWAGAYSFWISSHWW